MSNTLQSYLFDLDKFFYGGNHWQAGLYPQIESLTLEQVLWIPAPERHSIWEVLLHVNFWKQYVIATLNKTDKPDGDTGNWRLPEAPASAEQWQAELQRTKTLHEELKQAIIAVGEELFNTEERLSNYSRQLICHDAYHCGQIGLLRALQGIKAVE